MSLLYMYYTQATLALASYATLESGSPDVNALIGEGMTALQAGQFQSDWTVVRQYTDITGLSVTLFQNQNGQQSIAIRGTEFSQDLIADYILANGFPPELNLQF